MPHYPIAIIFSIFPDQLPGNESESYLWENFQGTKTKYWLAHKGLGVNG